MDSFLNAPNDYERMWILCDRQLSVTETLGPAVSAAVFCIELNKSSGFFDSQEEINKWYVKLYRNCLAQGIAVSAAAPEEIVPLVDKMVRQIIYDWCRCDGAFSVKKRRAKLARSHTAFCPNTA